MFFMAHELILLSLATDSTKNLDMIDNYVRNSILIIMHLLLTESSDVSRAVCWGPTEDHILATGLFV